MKIERQRNATARNAAFFFAFSLLNIGSLSAQTTIELPDNWQFSPDGGSAQAKFIEKFIVTGYSHVDNSFGAPTPTGIPGTFIETGLMQVSGYIDPATGLERPISDLTNKDVFFSWGDLAGDQLVTGTDVLIFFRTGMVKLYTSDGAQPGRLRIQDNSILKTEDSSSFTGLADGLVEIAAFQVIDYDQPVFNTETNSLERSGGSFDLNVGAGDGQFVVWGTMDAKAGHFYDGLGEDLDNRDADFQTYLGDDPAGDGSLQARMSVDAQQTPFTFRDTTSTDGPGCDDGFSDINGSLSPNCENDDPDALADASQEDNYEAAIAAIHGIGLPDLQQKLGATGGLEDFFAFHRGDADLQAVVEPPPLACRVTLGGVQAEFIPELGEDALVWDGSLVRNVNMATSETMAPANSQGRSNNSAEIARFRYSLGGQVGASTVLPPQPWGELEHNESGDWGGFNFHGGTRSAIAGTRITKVECSDPGQCEPGGNGPTKQIDIWGIGTFSTVKGFTFPQAAGEPSVVSEPKGKQGADGGVTFHYFEVNIDDAGEGPDQDRDQAVCPPDGFGRRGSAELVDCRCGDFYRMTIYDGLTANEVTYLADGRIDPASWDGAAVIYQVWGYITGKGLQIHKPTGKDLSNM